MQNRAKRERKGTYPCSLSLQQLLVQEMVLLTSKKQPQVAGMECGGVVLWIGVEMVQGFLGFKAWKRGRGRGRDVSKALNKIL